MWNGGEKRRRGGMWGLAVMGLMMVALVPGAWGDSDPNPNEELRHLATVLRNEPPWCECEKAEKNGTLNWSLSWVTGSEKNPDTKTGHWVSCTGCQPPLLHHRVLDDLLSKCAGLGTPTLCTRFISVPYAFPWPGGALVKAQFCCSSMWNNTAAFFDAPLIFIIPAALFWCIIVLISILVTILVRDSLSRSVSRQVGLLWDCVWKVRDKQSTSLLRELKCWAKELKLDADIDRALRRANEQLAIVNTISAWRDNLEHLNVTNWPSTYARSEAMYTFPDFRHWLNWKGICELGLDRLLASSDLHDPLCEETEDGTPSGDLRRSHLTSMAYSSTDTGTSSGLPKESFLNDETRTAAPPPSPATEATGQPSPVQTGPVPPDKGAPTQPLQSTTTTHDPDTRESELKGTSDDAPSANPPLNPPPDSLPQATTRTVVQPTTRTAHHLTTRTRNSNLTFSPSAASNSNLP